MSGRRDRALWFLPRNWREQEAHEQEQLAEQAEEARSRPRRVWRIGKRARELNEQKSQE